ncbi:MAG: hypothetical protein ACRDZ7_01610 [Acidimicrobiia bacterium]
MPAAVVLATVALALTVIALARLAVALDAVELDLRSAVTTVRALHRSLREAGALAQAVGRDSAAGEAALGRLEAMKTPGPEG